MPRKGLPPLAISVAGRDQLDLSIAAESVAKDADFFTNGGADSAPDACGLPSARMVKSLT